jgi:hypothetical protein
MADNDQIIEEQLDAALKEYGVVEPRAGLEGRILANLRSEGDQVVTRIWRWWPVLAVVTSMLPMGTAVLLRTKARPTRAAIVTTGLATVPAATEVRRARGNEVQVQQRSRGHGRESRIEVSVPRLEQFPSPQPLSEQEELLADYIEQFPHQAVLVARAQTQLMKQEMMERDLPLEDAGSTDSQQENP